MSKDDKKKKEIDDIISQAEDDIDETKKNDKDDDEELNDIYALPETVDNKQTVEEKFDNGEEVVPKEIETKMKEIKKEDIEEQYEDDKDIIDEMNEDVEEEEDDEDTKIPKDNRENRDKNLIPIESETDFKERNPLKMIGKNFHMYFIRPVEEIDIVGKNYENSIKRIVLITKRPFEDEFYPTQMQLSIKGFEMSVKAGLCDLVLVDWLTYDTPILFCDYSKRDAFEKIHKFDEVQFIKTNRDKIMSRLLFHMRKFMTEAEEKIAEAEFKEQEAKRDLAMYVKKLKKEKYRNMPVEDPFNQVEKNKIIVQKPLYWFLVICTCILFIVLSILMFSSLLGYISTNPGTTSTTTTVIDDRQTTPKIIELISMIWRIKHV